MKYKAADLFCGGGGFHLAMDRVGDFDVVFACEYVESIAKVYESNFGINPLCDMYALSTEQIKAIGEVDLVTAGFPCQPFSANGVQRGFLDEKNGKGFFATRDFIDVSKPKAFVCENVYGLTTKKFKDTFEFILSEFDRIGYNVKWGILRSCEFGVPQIRKRVYMVGVRKDIDFNYEFPDRGNCEDVKLGDILESNVDFEWYEPQDRADRQLAKMNSYNEKDGKKSSFCWKILESDKLSFALSTNCMDKTTLNVIVQKPFDLEDYLRLGLNREFLRSLTYIEYLRLQGFPENYIHSCSKTMFGKIIGNAITVPVAAAVIKNLLSALK